MPHVYSTTASELSVKPVKMKTDKPIPGILPPLHASSFCYILVGGPGSGKSTLVRNLLMNKSMLGRKYDAVHYYSPSLATIDIPLPKNRLHDSVDVIELEQTMKDLKKGENALFVFDDCPTMIPRGAKGNVFARLCFNRRHLAKGDGAFASVIIITQKMNMLPTSVRAAANGLFLWYSASAREKKTIYEEFINDLSEKDFDALCDYAWDKAHDFMFIRLDRLRSQGGKYHKGFEEIKIM